MDIVAVVWLDFYVHRSFVSLFVILNLLWSAKRRQILQEFANSWIFIYLFFYNYVFNQRGRPPGPARKNDAKKKKATNDKSKDAVDDGVVCKGKGHPKKNVKLSKTGKENEAYCMMSLRSKDKGKEPAGEQKFLDNRKICLPCSKKNVKGLAEDQEFENDEHLCHLCRPQLRLPKDPFDDPGKLPSFVMKELDNMIRSSLSCGVRFSFQK